MGDVKNPYFYSVLWSSDFYFLFACSLMASGFCFSWPLPVFLSLKWVWFAIVREPPPPSVKVKGSTVVGAQVIVGLFVVLIMVVISFSHILT